MTALNEFQKRHLLTTFEYIDHTLTEALHLLSPTDQPSPLGRLRADALPIQRKVIADFIDHFRAIMIRILEDGAIPIRALKISAIWSFRTTLVCVRTALAELAPRYMRSYGALPDDTARQIEIATAQLLDIVERMDGYLSEGAGQDLRTRLAKLEKTTRGARCVKIIEEVIETHGLVELRASLATLIERLESTSFEVAVFGRVNSGKSSLLNYILRTTVLPVGVTPVTALPTRVVFGPRPRVVIDFAEGKAAIVEPDQLSSYVTEQANPENARHVSRIQVELPADMLRDGITFVDTPGLGSLARYGEMETLAYLPRCDLGIVLVEATSTLNQEDVLIMNALLRAGVNPMVLLTKADMLSPDERTTVSHYIQAQFRAHLGIDVPVNVISVKGEQAGLCSLWIETALVPGLREHRRLADSSLTRKIGLMCEATEAVLRRRRDQKLSANENSDEQSASVETLLNRALATLEKARLERVERRNVGERILESASAEIADVWRSKSSWSVDAAPVIASLGSREANQIAGAVASDLNQLKKDLDSVLSEAARTIGYGYEEDSLIPPPTGMPALDLSTSLKETPLRRPRHIILTKGGANRRARRELEARTGPRLQELLERYFRELEAWRQQCLSEMGRSFTAKAGFYRIPSARPSDKSNMDAIENDLRRLKSLESREEES